jgi:hypothetical protein
MESYPRQCRDEISGKTYVAVLEPWEDNGVIMMQNEETGEYGCFGCGKVLCIDPAPIMKQVEETEDRYCNNDFELVENGKVVEKNEVLEEQIKNEAGGQETSEIEESQIINGKTLAERLEEAYSNLHKKGSAQKIRDDFPDIELTFTDEGDGSNIYPFEYYYSGEADKTFNLCAVERTVFICEGKLDRMITDEEIDNVELCDVTPIYINEF